MTTIIIIVVAITAAYISNVITSNKLNSSFRDQLESYADDMYDQFNENVSYIESKLEAERVARELAEAKLSAISEHRIDPSDYVHKDEYESITKEYLTVKESRDKLVSEQKSKEVRLGAIAETLAPFLDGFPYDPKKLRALGSPIDYIAFEDDCIVLIEIKSGDSKLSKNQKSIKSIVESGNVRFETYRIDKDGINGD